MAEEGAQTVGVEVKMTADLDVIPADPNSRIAKIGLETTSYDGRNYGDRVHSTEDDINLLIALDEPELVVRALLRVAERNGGEKWTTLAALLRQADVMFEDENKPSR
jgi:hypothetical protein